LNIYLHAWGVLQSKHLILHVLLQAVAVAGAQKVQRFVTKYMKSVTNTRTLSNWINKYSVEKQTLADPQRRIFVYLPETGLLLNIVSQLDDSTLMQS
jgi:hypothetical protein